MWNGIASNEEEVAEKELKEEAAEKELKKEAASFLYTKVGEYEWIKISALAALLRNAPQHIRRYMKQYHYKDYFEEFLNEYDKHFYIKNGRVAQYQDSFDIGYEEAVTYCENILATYLEPVDIRRFRGHLGQAKPEARDFIKRFYSGEEFEQFFLCNDDVFVVYKNNTVWLIESDCARHFKQAIEKYGGGEYFENFRGHIGQASRHIIDYMNKNYPDEEFLTFLLNHPDVFDIDEELNVFLQPE